MRGRQEVAAFVTAPAPQILQIHHAGDVIAAQGAARSLAREIGFSDAESEQIALAASELATNLVRHANGGTLRMSPLGDGDRRGIAVETEDEGPGIAHPERALTDGFSTAGGLGLGLGTVHRIMDELDFSSRPAGGLKVSCRRWSRPPTSGVFPRQLVFGVATRARRNELQNGDAFVVRRWSDGALAGVIDGLGHGEHAERAAHVARAYVEDHYDQPVSRLFEGVGLACRHTRGVVMALARFDLAAAAVDIGSVGNVEVRFLGGRQTRDVIVRRGILGVNAPNPAVTSHAWTDATTLVLHSDGLHTHWNAEQIDRIRRTTPSDAAQSLLEVFGKNDDDATVVVVRSVAG